MVRLSDRSLDYDRLILATGAVPVRPMLDGDAAGEIMSVNSLDHYATFRARLVPGMRVAIIGAGLVGCEFANDLSQHGHPVTVIDPLPTPLGQLVPRAIGTAMRDALAAQNVSWQLGNCVTAIDRNGMALSLLLSDGTTMPADIVLSAIGLRPAMALAHDAGLTVERGILVDDHGRTSDHDIFAIGDCAQYPHGLSAFITPIMAAARAIAATVTGTPTAMRFPALSVQVKTSACPLVLLAPPTGTDGTWVSAQRDAAGEKHLFLTATGQVTGYAMTGRFCDQRMDLDRAIMSEEGLRDVA
jgi:rubredoxin-NAD+ reductase